MGISHRVIFGVFFAVAALGVLESVLSDPPTTPPWRKARDPADNEQLSEQVEKYYEYYDELGYNETWLESVERWNEYYEEYGTFPNIPPVPGPPVQS